MATLNQWIAGARPRTLPAAIAPVIVGTAAAAPLDRANLGLALLALLVSVGLQVGVNYANDYSDGIRGTDGERVGPVRLVGQHLANPDNVKLMAFAFFGVRGPRRARPRGVERGLDHDPAGGPGRARSVEVHRRRQPLRLPRPRRGLRLPVLRPDGDPRHALHAGQGAHLGRPRRRRRRRRDRLRDPRGQQPARHPHRPRERQADPGRPARRPRHPRGSTCSCSSSSPSPWSSSSPRATPLALRRPARRSACVWKPLQALRTGATGRDLVPVLAATGLFEIAYAVLLAVGIAASLALSVG